MDEEKKNETENIPDEELNTEQEAETVEKTETAESEEPEKELTGREKKNEIKRLKAELEKAKKAAEEAETRAKEAEDKYLRIAAEYDNFRRRSQTEKSNVYDSAVADTLAGLLPVIDNLQYASKYSGGDSEKFAEGVELILGKLPETLEKLGITAYGAQGDEFNPEIHNAVLHTEDESLGENVIAEVLQCGYMRGDKVLRCAMVKVAN